MPESNFLSELLILFALSVAVVLLFHRARLPPIIGFLITGVLCGPYGFGLLRNVSEVEALAEIGVVLLLFTVGIEFSIDQLLRLRTFLLGGGGLQVAVTLLAIAGVSRVAGNAWRVSIFLGMLVALSSTAIVLRLYADRGETDAPHARAALGILIFQDLCIVPMVLLTPLLTGQGGGWGSIAMVMLKAVGFVAAAVFAARYVIPRLLHSVVRTRKREVFLLTIILLCLGTAWASAEVGLSLALGAFIAGLIVSESEYSHQALGEVLPFREVFNSLFFVSIGMLFDVRTVLGAPFTVLGTLAVVVSLKALVIIAVAVAMGQSLRVSVLAALGLAQIGEFSFVLSKVGLTGGLLDRELDQLFLAVAVGSMALTPALIGVAPRVAVALERVTPSRWRRGRALPDEGDGDTPPLRDHVIIVGYGVNGRNLARVLARVGIPYIVVEMNPDTVRSERRRGRPVIFGDATRPEILAHARLDVARVVVVAISDAAATRAVVAQAKRLNQAVYTIVRTRYVKEMEELFTLGTNEVVPEEFETSVEIFSRVLGRYLVPKEVIEKSVADIRRDGYEMFRGMSDIYQPEGGLARFLSELTLRVLQVHPDSRVAGRTLAESGIRSQSGATVVAVQRVGSALVVNPDGDDPIGAGDTVLLLGKPEQLERAEPLFHAGATRRVSESWPLPPTPKALP